MKYWNKKSVVFKEITTFDVAISGILFAIFLIFYMIKKTFFPGPLNIEIEHLFYILVGLIFPLMYGISFSILCDFSKLLIRGRIADWSYVYAIIPPLIVIISWLFFSMFKKNRTGMLIFGSFMLMVAMYLNIFFVAYNSNNIEALKKLQLSDVNTAAIIIIVISTIFALIVTSSIIFIWSKFLYNKNKGISNEKLEIAFMIFALIAIISVIFRWAYGNFALVHWINTRRAISGSSKPLIEYFSHEYYAFGVWMMMKSAFEILIFVFVLIPLYSVIDVLKQKYMVEQLELKW